MKRATWLLAIVVLFFATGGYWYYKIHHQAKIIQPEATTITVYATKPLVKDIPDEVNAIGTLIANQSVEISPQVAGQVSAILFQEGSCVKKGTPLIKLDDTIIKTNLQAATADLALAKGNFKRVTQLVKNGYISRQEFDTVKELYQEKQSAVDVNTSMLQKMVLVAPFDGILGSRKISVGDYVQVGQGILKIVDKNKLRVVYELPEKYLPRLKIGQEIIVTVDALPNQEFKGNISFISPEINTSSHTIQIEAIIPNNEQKLSPGMFVKIKQIFGMIKNSLVIPEQCLMPTMEGQQVYKVVNNKAVLTNIKVGNYFKGTVHILDGITANDLIVTDGLEKIKDGANVEVKSA